MKSLFISFVMVTFLTSFSSFSVAADTHAQAHHELAISKVHGDLSIMVLGSGGPIATSVGRASAGYMLFRDGDPNPVAIMDVGGGVYQRVAQSGTNIADLKMFLLSHLHADHTGDLTSVIKTLYFHNNMKGQVRTTPVVIYGPDSTAYKGDPGTVYPNGQLVFPSTTDYADGHYSVNGGVERYLNAFVPAITNGAGTFSYEAHNLNSAWKVDSNPQPEVVYNKKGLKITSMPVNHGPVPAVAYRIDYKGHSIVYSGDTSSVSDNMITLARNADILIYDTSITKTLPPVPVFHVLHTTPERMGQVAAAANVKELVLSHITPVTETRIPEVKAAIRANGFTGEIREAEDLQVYNLGDDD
jgi:ribonuclease BN (tRNA processing enzyme)